MSESPDEPVSSRAIQIIQEVNLPALVAGPAGRALSRLIGAAVDIPAAAIENVTSRIRDDARSRSMITAAVAKEAAAIAAADPELVQRSLYRWLGENARKQINREKVAELAAEELSKSADGGIAAEPTQEWMDVFTRHAETATSDSVRNTWARILAGEIQRTGKYSLRTLRFISEMDQQTARIFQEIGPLVVSENFIPQADGDEEIELLKLVHLEEVGLIAGASSGFSKTFTPRQRVDEIIEGAWSVRITIKETSKSYSMRGVLITSLGKEVLQLIDRSDPERRLRWLAKCLEKEDLQKVELGHLAPGAGVGRMYEELYPDG